MRALEPLRVQFRETIRADGSVYEERLAFCSTASRWVSLLRCNACEACAHLSGDQNPVLVCAVAPHRPSNLAPSVREWMAQHVWCIEGRAPARLISLMPDDQRDAIVVDGDGHAIGLLSREQAVSVDEALPAQEAMDPAIVALFDNAPLESAHDLLSAKGVRTLPILSAGRVIGCVDTRQRTRG